MLYSIIHVSYYTRSSLCANTVRVRVKRCEFVRAGNNPGAQGVPTEAYRPHGIDLGAPRGSELPGGPADDARVGRDARRAAARVRTRDAHDGHRDDGARDPRAAAAAAHAAVGHRELPALRRRRAAPAGRVVQDAAAGRGEARGPEQHAVGRRGGRRGGRWLRLAAHERRVELAAHAVQAELEGGGMGPPDARRAGDAQL